MIEREKSVTDCKRRSLEMPPHAGEMISPYGPVRYGEVELSFEHLSLKLSPPAACLQAATR